MSQPKPSVLVIEDSPTQRHWLCAVMRACGFFVAEANSTALLELVAQPQQFSAVLVALRLLNGNGFELGVGLREAGCERVWVYSDIEAATDGAWAQALGLQGILTLPAPLPAVRRQLQEAVFGSAQREL